MSHHTDRSARFNLQWSNVFFKLRIVRRVPDDFDLDRSVHFAFETPFG